MQAGENARYVLVAVDRDGKTVAVGVGPSMGEALLRLAAPAGVELADEPPF